MIRHIYVEQEIAAHPRTRQICNKFPNATIIPCDRYTSVFNSNAQNFRLQKKNPSLILARKHQNRVTPTPAGYGIGSTQNYYFSHMLNCLYDCRYCFLQGMYRSAHYVVFVNYDDFIDDIRNIARESIDPSWFFSGYDCDSLAMEPVTGFISYALDQFASCPSAHLEIRTKSTQIRDLLARDPIENAVIAYSLTPDTIASALEHKAPSVEKRINSLKKLQNHGWKVGLRLDPMIHSATFKQDYETLLDNIFSQLDCTNIHSVSFGSFRLPKGFYKKMVRLYPRERLFATDLTENNSMVSYGTEIEQECKSILEALLLRHISKSILFPCS
ncbi:DNA photolyase [Chromatiales bacterium (ex Bugula neritina AB1)]|nr:DNA photolyase [Chromatiales bacterium (ex Bugula neritina AB1)]